MGALLAADDAIGNEGAPRIELESRKPLTLIKLVKNDKSSRSEADDDHAIIKISEGWDRCVTRERWTFGSMLDGCRVSRSPKVHDSTAPTYFTSC
jgi:hypothetical protein